MGIVSIKNKTKSGSLLVGNTAYNPVTSIANLKGWYDANDATTITASGSAVTQWNDKSGNSYNVTQGTAGRRPVTGTRTQNGKNMIDFQGDDVLQAATASNWTFMSNSTGATVFIAAFYDTSASYRWQLSTGTADTTGIGAEVAADDQDKIYGVVMRGVSATRVSDSHTTASVTDNTANYFSMKIDNANATAANRILTSINAGTAYGANTFTGVASSSDPAHPLYIGSYDTAGSSGFDGGICEIIIYSGILSNGDITLINSYLASKWGM